MLDRGSGLLYPWEGRELKRLFTTGSAHTDRSVVYSNHQHRRNDSSSNWALPGPKSQQREARRRKPALLAKDTVPGFVSKVPARSPGITLGHLQVSLRWSTAYKTRPAVLQHGCESVSGEQSREIKVFKKKRRKQAVIIMPFPLIRKECI